MIAMKNKVNTKKLALAGVLAALTTVATMIIQIPTPTKGFVNLGDCIVNVTAWLLGGLYGCAAAGIGSALADIISGYVIYAPATLVIKFLMALCSWKVFTALKEKHNTFVSTVTASVIAELVMSVGYFLYESVLYSPATAVTGIGGNVAQGVMGIISAVAIHEIVLKRLPEKYRF